MIIKNVSCTQFAGVRDRSISFTDGINIVYGKNESGKSTLVNLISRTLFQNAKLDGRKDKDFLKLYFPAARKGSSIVGDFADGKITFEAKDGTYTLSKEWGDDPRCTLSTPNGVIRKQSEISNILADALLYGEGVYTDMLLSSQRNNDLSLQTLLDASQKSDAKQEITNAVSQAFAESDGIPVDAVEQAIAKKIDELAGKHWDFDRQAPARRASRWATGLGEILKAYYAWEDVQIALNKISDLEREADNAAQAYADEDAKARSAEEEYNRFNTFASRIAVQSERKKAIARMKQDLKTFEDVLQAWPQLKEKLEKAKNLKFERENRAVFDLWNQVNEERLKLTDEDRATAELPCPESAEIPGITKIQREISRLENRLCGMNLNAAISMLNGHQVEIVSVRTGKSVDVSNGIASITEAVKITIPGVMEMQLSPADVDVASVEKQIEQKKEQCAAVFAKYHVDTLEQLEVYAQKIDTAKAKIDRINTEIARLLGNVSHDQLEARYAQIGSIHRSMEDIDREIRAVCGSTEISIFITKANTIIDGYIAEHTSISDLESKKSALTAELRKAEGSVADVEDIPAEYLNIADPDGHLQKLHDDMKSLQDHRDEAFKDKADTSSKLDTYKDEHPDACEETVDNARANLEEVKSLLNHWLHIQDVFKAQKANLNDNPMEDIAAHFTDYLSTISGGRVSSEFPEADRLAMHIYSDSALLDYGKLSEGTKETVSLAFRLAVVDHLFPEGGGVIVFDDPFTDMDADRTAQSCKLVQECAQRHQVIFLTCDEKYLDMLEGNQIPV